MKPYRSLLAAALAGLAVAASGGASASLCAGDSSVVGTSATGDVLLNGDPADVCEILGNQNSGQGGGTIGALTTIGTSGWTELYNTESGGTGTVDATSLGSLSFTGYTFTSTGLQGTFGLSYVGGPTTIDFLFSMHAGGNSGYFFFDDVPLVLPVGTSAGTWEINWYNSGAQNPNYSNVQFWARPGDPTPPVRELPVPEPAMLSLIGVALAGAALGRRAARKVK